MRKVTGSLSKSQCTVVFLNQLRSKIGVIYGSPEVTSGESRSCKQPLLAPQTWMDETKLWWYLPRPFL